MSLKEQLVAEQKLRWIDIGCGGNFEEGFVFLDTFPENFLDPEVRDRYHRTDILNCPKEEIKKLGKFDLARMQHTLEHFSLEEGQRVLLNCADLLKDDGFLLITVPDLRIHVGKYLEDGYKGWEEFKQWAKKRIPENSPNSFYFSIFAHSMPYESHRWCYDYEGLKFLLECVGRFTSIKQLAFSDPAASFPFTHNRPSEDLCVIAQKAREA